MVRVEGLAYSEGRERNAYHGETTAAAAEMDTRPARSELLHLRGEREG